VDLAGLVERANLALGRLDGSAQILPNPDLFVSMYVRKEAVLSSQIEGTQASLVDVLQFESQIADTDLPGDVSEVVGYVKALQQGLARVAKERLTLKLIRDLHRTLLSEGRGADRQPGEFRKVQNWIGPKGGIGHAVFVPPSPENLRPALNDLERFLNTESAMPAVIAAGLAHVQFETIHPFIDGNGRTGRLLLTLLLCQRKVLSQPLLYLSEFFKRRRAEYYDRLQAVRDNGDWEGWIRFYLTGVAEVAEEAAQTARRVINLREKHRQLVADEMKHGSGNALSFLERLYFRPVVTVRAVQDMTEISFPNANKLVSRFEELGILKEMTGQRRNRRFKYAEYLALFTSEEEDD
jgi:Fic family protein